MKRGLLKNVQFSAITPFIVSQRCLRPGFLGDSTCLSASHTAPYPTTVTLLSAPPASPPSPRCCFPALSRLLHCAQLPSRFLPRRRRKGFRTDDIYYSNALTSVNDKRGAYGGVWVCRSGVLHVPSDPVLITNVYHNSWMFTTPSPALCCS